MHRRGRRPRAACSAARSVLACHRTARRFLFSKAPLHRRHRARAAFPCRWCCRSKKSCHPQRPAMPVLHRLSFARQSWDLPAVCSEQRSRPAHDRCAKGRAIVANRKRKEAKRQTTTQRRPTVEKSCVRIHPQTFEPSSQQLQMFDPYVLKQRQKCSFRLCDLPGDVVDWSGEAKLAATSESPGDNALAVPPGHFA